MTVWAWQLVGSTLITTLISSLVGLSFWFLFQRRIQAGDKEVVDLKSEVHDLRDQKLVDLRSRLDEKTDDLRARINGEATARRELKQHVDDNCVKYKELMPVNDDIREIKNELRGMGGTLKSVSDTVERIMTNVKLDFGRRDANGESEKV